MAHVLVDKKDVYFQTFIDAVLSVSSYQLMENPRTHRAAPIIRLLDSLRARGSFGCMMRLHNCAISAVWTDRLGSFLKVDLDPRVAASLMTVRI